MTFSFVKVSIEVEPNRVVHTSPARFDPLENTFITRYPKAIAPTDIIVIDASPFIFPLLPPFKSKIAAIMVTGNTSTILSVRLNTVDTATAPNATCESPSPINENRFNTRITPSSEEHSAISMPTTIAYLTKG